MSELVVREDYEDECSACTMNYNTTNLIKWCVCLSPECNEHKVKFAVCSECVVHIVLKRKNGCLCVKKILAEYGELSVKELNSKDTLYNWLKDSVRQQRVLAANKNQLPPQP